jgi:hypothetical protein
MFAREDDVLMIPIIGTGFGVIEEGVISSMVVQDDAPLRLELIAMLMGEPAIPAFVSVQEAGCAAPMTGGPFLSFWQGWVFIGPSWMGEGHAWSFGVLYELWNNMRHRFCGMEAFVGLRLLGMCGTFLLYEVSVFEVNRSLSCFEAFLPLFQVSKLTL